MKNVLYTSLCLLFAAVLSTGCKQENNSADVVASVVTISLLSEQEVLLNGESVAIDEVGSQLQTLAKEANTYVVYDFAPAAPMSSVHEIMRQATGAGVAGVRFAGERNDSQQVRFYRPALAAR